MKIKLLTSVASVMLLTGCVSSLNDIIVPADGKPKWLKDPYYQNDKIAAVGCSPIHFNGEQAQKKLAISRAIDQIAVQKKVTVNNVTLRRKSSSNGSAYNSRSTSSTSLQSVDNLSMSTKVKAIYTKKDGEMCAWVILK